MQIADTCINDLSEINPADWHNTRELKWIPDHFTTFPLGISEIFDNQLNYWLINNTTGRYAFGTKQTSSDLDTSLLDISSWIVGRNLLGFENQADATMFALQYCSKNNTNPLF